MTEQGLKRLLYQFDASKRQVEQLKNSPGLLQDMAALSSYGRQSCQIKFLTGAMRILSRQEMYVVKTRLMCHNTWADTTSMFEEKYGVSMARSERTLKEVQSRALKKMTDFINRMPTGDCFEEKTKLP